MTAKLWRIVRLVILVVAEELARTLAERKKTGRRQGREGQGEKG
jgi:hypothetical protein